MNDIRFLLRQVDLTVPGESRPEVLTALLLRVAEWAREAAPILDAVRICDVARDREKDVTEETVNALERAFERLHAMDRRITEHSLEGIDDPTRPRLIPAFDGVPPQE